MNAPRKPEACKAKYAGKKTHKVHRSDKGTKTQMGEGKTALRNIVACEAKHTDKQTNVCKRGKELKGEALHKPEVCDAKHTHITNKSCANGKGTE